METKSIRLCDSKVFQVENCVICGGADGKLTGGPDGRKRIWTAAVNKKDAVYARILSIPDRETFVYHLTYNCYIKYIKVIPKSDSDNNIEKQNDNNVEKEQNSEDLTDLNSINLRSKLSLKRQAEVHDMRKIVCACCGQISLKKDAKKSRIELPETAQVFLTMTQKLKDETFHRTAHLQTVDSILYDGVFYHADCFRNYKKKYEKQLENESKQLSYSSPDVLTEKEVDFCENETFDNVNNQESVSDKLRFTNEFIKSIVSRVLSGEAFELSSLTKAIENKYFIEGGFDNRTVKKALIDNFGENICFSYPKQKNRSAMVFYSKLSKSDMADTIRTDKTNIMKKCAVDLRSTLKNLDFDLNDRYCDENDLRTSWNNFKIPNSFVEFFSAFFKIDASRLKNQNVNENNKIDLKVLKIKCIIQMLYYIMNDGRMRTPLHVSTGLSIHHATRNKTLVTELNHLGLSISYAEVERYRIGLATFAAKSAETITPLPTHFDPKIFTIAAFDNFDHQGCSFSGKEGCHDTVSVVIQEKSSSINFQKPKISDSNDHQVRSFDKPMNCQLKKCFGKIPKRISLPPSFIASTQEKLVTPESYRRIFSYDDLAWFLCRIYTGDEFELGLSICKNGTQKIPSWSPFHSTLKDDTRPSAHIGFLPNIPHPVTEADTVYTGLGNFNEVVDQLHQKFLPIACDEGVYKLARPIKFIKDEEMKKLFIMLGDFHDEKVTYNCGGKYLTGSGMLNAVIECKIVGKNVAEQALNGEHYERSSKLFLIIFEALTRLQLKAFFTSERLNKYKDILHIIEDLKNAIEEGNIDESKSLLAIFIDVSESMKNDLETFIEKRSNESPMFKYFNNLLIMLDIAYSGRKAVRMGDWKMYVNSLTKKQPLYQALDRVNYSRHSPIYLEDCLNLERDMPEIYQHFMNGGFTVKQTSKPFSSVAIDQALEQSINKSGKSPSGIIGVTSNKNAVTVWNLIFHETMGINSFYREILGLESDSEELRTHHELNESNTEFFEKAVTNLVQYLLTHINPFEDGCQPLQDIVGGQLVDDKAAEKLLNIFEIGCTKFNDFREKRIITKQVSLSDTIHKTNLPNFKTVFKEPEKKKASQKLDLVHRSFRIIDIAREREYDIKKLLCYDITPVNLLFDADGLITNVSDKSDLASTLEIVNNLDLDSDYDIGEKTILSCIVDVMLYCRKVSWNNLQTFSGFADAFCKLISWNISPHTAKRIDFVFDDYFQNSPKASERMHRSKGESIMIVQIKDNTPLPNDSKKFYSSEISKKALQIFLRKYILQHCNAKWPDTEVVFSTLQTLECISTLSHLKSNPGMPALQRFDIEEADTKIVLHVNDCCMEGDRKILVLSCDTDILVLLLNFWNIFSCNGLQELWMRIGTQDSTRDLPLHKLANKMGPNKCQTIIAAHHLTGSDYTSKVGNKPSSIRAEPEKYLLDFGRGSSIDHLNNCQGMAEEYLAKVYQKNTVLKNFNELRYQRYHWSTKACDLETLPPTSASMALHINRAFYITYQQVNCLNKNADKLDPLLYGYDIQDNLLVPKKIYILLPPLSEFVPNCRCTACTRTKSCCCLEAKIKCCSFCLCQKNDTCKNKFNEPNEEN